MVYCLTCLLPISCRKNVCDLKGGAGIEHEEEEEEEEEEEGNMA